MARGAYLFLTSEPPGWYITLKPCTPECNPNCAAAHCGQASDGTEHNWPCCCYGFIWPHPVRETLQVKQRVHSSAGGWASERKRYLAVCPSEMECFYMRKQCALLQSLCSQPTPSFGCSSAKQHSRLAGGVRLMYCCRRQSAGSWAVRQGQPSQLNPFHPGYFW